MLESPLGAPGIGVTIGRKYKLRHNLLDMRRGAGHSGKMRLPPASRGPLRQLTLVKPVDRCCRAAAKETVRRVERHGRAGVEPSTFCALPRVALPSRSWRRVRPPQPTRAESCGSRPKSGRGRLSRWADWNRPAASSRSAPFPATCSRSSPPASPKAPSSTPAPSSPAQKLRPAGDAARSGRDAKLRVGSPAARSGARRRPGQSRTGARR